MYLKLDLRIDSLKIFAEDIKRSFVNEAIDKIIFERRICFGEICRHRCFIVSSQNLIIMPEELRKSGVNVLGDISWGSHFCQFYETKEDLLELLIPFFKAGLENNEYCIWIVCDPIPEEEAYKALQKSIPDFQKHIEKKNIEIFSCGDWYTRSGKFDSKSVIRTALQKLENALKKGYDGVRMNGNEAWLSKDDWSDFMKYETEINDILRNTQMIILCTYPLHGSDGGALLDVAHAHECVVTRRKGKWEILEEPEIKNIKTELQRKSAELELLVEQRTNQLTQAVEQLKLEIEERKKAEERIKGQIELTNEIIHTIPTMIWCILPDGKLGFVNQPWMNYTGLSLAEAREAPAGIVHPEDRPRAMKKWEQNRDAGNYHEDEMRLRAANGQYRWFLVQTAPLKDNYGKIIKWYGVSTEIEERKRTEEKLGASYKQIRSLSEHLRNIREEERKHVAREIHDELGQQLTVLKMDVGSLTKKIPQPDDIMRKRLASFSELVDNIVQSVRRISSELRPSLLDDFDLPVAVSWHLEEFGKRSAIKTHFTEPKDEWILPDAIKTNLFRILQEALTNVVRHSKATEVKVNLERDDHTITLHIFDNGVGYSMEKTSNGNTLGILGMRERANIIGGKLEIETMTGKGTRIVVTVPYS